MPRGDRTGPMGMGPMTGRGLGYCAGFAGPGFTRGGGRGMGRGMGFGGRGWRNWFHATGLPGWMRASGAGMPMGAPDPGTEKEMLQGQMQALQAELEALQNRLNDLEKTE